MEFALAITTTYEVQQKGEIINSLSDDLKHYFYNKQYGADIVTYIINVVCVSPKFEMFFKEKKPKYTKGRKDVMSYGIPSTLENNFEYDIKIDFEGFKIADEEESKKMIAKEILSSLVVFDKMKSKVKDFDMDSFRADIEEYFKSRNLI